jgi:hypothetical protein
MKVEFEKKMRIASTMLSFCHMHGATEFHLDIKIAGSSAEFIIKADSVSLSDGDLESLDKKLNAPRHYEIEQDYWTLMGDSEDFCELTLVGMMSDRAIVTYEGQSLTINIRRSSAGTSGPPTAYGIP